MIVYKRFLQSLILTKMLQRSAVLATLSIQANDPGPRLYDPLKSGVKYIWSNYRQVCLLLRASYVIIIHEELVPEESLKALWFKTQYWVSRVVKGKCFLAFRVSLPRLPLCRGIKDVYDFANFMIKRRRYRLK